MAKKRFESLAIAEQLSQAVEKVVQLIPPETGTEATLELRRISSSAVGLILEQTEQEFRKTIRTLKSPVKPNPNAVAAE